MHPPPLARDSGPETLGTSNRAPATSSPGCHGQCWLLKGQLFESHVLRGRGGDWGPKVAGVAPPATPWRLGAGPSARRCVGVALCPVEGGSGPCPGRLFLELGKTFPRLKQHLPSRPFLRLRRTRSLFYFLDATVCPYRGTSSPKLRVAPVRFRGRGPRSGRLQPDRSAEV